MGLVEQVEAGNVSEVEREVIESEVPGGYPKVKEVQRIHWGGLEGPPEVPEFAFALGRRLTRADSQWCRFESGGSFCGRFSRQDLGRDLLPRRPILSGSW